MPNDYMEQAIPHEAGHIVVGRSFGWIRIRGLAINIVRDQRGITFGDFATASTEPSDEAIAITPPERMAEYKVFIGGGLAGNLFARVPAAEESLQSDRRQLARVGPESLEEMAERAVSIIDRHHQTFSHLLSLVRQRLQSLLSDISLSTGRHTLLSEQDITDIFN
jgi:hypothetical protein